jgi:hypothetical protein
MLFPNMRDFIIYIVVSCFIFNHFLTYADAGWVITIVTSLALCTAPKSVAYKSYTIRILIYIGTFILLYYKNYWPIKIAPAILTFLAFTISYIVISLSCEILNTHQEESHKLNN